MCIRDRNTDNTSLAEFLEEVALVSEIDNLDEDSSYVVLMTVHSAKAVSYTHLDVYKRQSQFKSFENASSISL